MSTYPSSPSKANAQALAELSQDAGAQLARALSGDEQARWALAQSAWAIEKLAPGAQIVAQARQFLEPLGMWNEAAAGERG